MLNGLHIIVLLHFQVFSRWEEFMSKVKVNPGEVKQLTFWITHVLYSDLIVPIFCFIHKTLLRYFLSKAALARVKSLVNRDEKKPRKLFIVKSLPKKT